MTERAQSGGPVPNACPFLALDEDRDRRSAAADGRHRCYAEPAPQPRALTYQETYCLSPAFAACRSFLDWAARAAAEPLPGQTRASGAASQPLAPIPAPVTPAPVAPARPAINPVVPPASVLPPPPPTYAPPPAWQPPGTPPPDTSSFTWATPPPWVAEPEMRSTATLPDSARPPLDAERLGWTTSGSTGTLAPAPLDEGTDSYPEWPPAPRSSQVTGTFGSRRAPEPFAPLPLDPVPPILDAPPMAALVAADLPLAPEDDLAQQQRGSTGGATDATGSDWGAWTDEQDTPAAWPQSPVTTAWSGEPVAIPVGDGPSAAPAVPTAWQGMMGDPGSGPVPIEPAPPPSTPPPAGLPPTAAIPPDAGQTVRRSPPSRWLPSFLSKDAPPPDAVGAAAVAARTGPASAVSASAVLPEELLADDAATPDPTASWAATPATPVTGALPTDPMAVDRPATTATAAVAATATVAAAPPPDEDPPGTLAPRRRKQPPGVPVDSNAPSSVSPQVRGTRTKGSGEWNQPKPGASRGGWRRFIPGVVPPVALGALVLFLGAALLFLMPGFLAGGGATPAPLATEEPAGVLASGRPERSIAPVPSEAPSGEFDIYTVKSGDTLIDIARQFSVTQEALICANRQLRRNPNLLSVGQELQIPPEDWTCPAPTKTKKP